MVIRRNVQALAMQVDQVGEFFLDVDEVLDRKSSLEEEENPLNQAVWLRHVQPERSRCLEMAKLGSLDELNFMRFLHEVGTYYRLSQGVKLLRRLHQAIVDAECVMDVKGIREDNVVQDLGLGLHDFT